MLGPLCSVEYLFQFLGGVFVTHHAVGEVRFCVSIRDKAGVAFFDGFFIFFFVIHQLQEFCHE